MKDSIARMVSLGEVPRRFAEGASCEMAVMMAGASVIVVVVVVVVVVFHFGLILSHFFIGNLKPFIHIISFSFIRRFLNVHIHCFYIISNFI